MAIQQIPRVINAPTGEPSEATQQRMAQDISEALTRIAEVLAALDKRITALETP